MNNNNGMNSSASVNSSSTILPIDSPALKLKPEPIEVMDLSQSITLGDTLPDNWRLVDMVIHLNKKTLK